MEPPLTTFLLYSLRFLAIFSVVMLWVVAMSEIGSHTRLRSFPTVKLASVAVAVSTAAVGAIVAVHAALPLGPLEAAPEPAVSPSAGPECEGFSYGFTYSFGLEGPVHTLHYRTGNVAKSSPRCSSQ